MRQEHTWYVMRYRRGMTLVELLMVVAVMTILMVVAIPMLRPAFEDRQLREASRQVNTVFAGAQARAASTGRSVGIWIERQRDEDGRLYATRLYTAEVSPGYTGAILGARATIEPTTFTLPPSAATEWPNEFDGTSLGRLHFSEGNAYLQSLVADTEIFFIRFDHKGYNYACIRVGADFFISTPLGIPPGTAHTGSGLTYEITRGPSKSAVTPVTLPGDSILDLTVSGVGLSQYSHSFDYELLPSPPPSPLPPPAPVIIMFAPTGQLGHVYVDNVAKMPVGPVHLLVGRRSKISDDVTLHDPELSNISDSTNLWITINNRTGAITTDDNAATYALPPGTPRTQRIRAAREFARASRQKGGQ